MADPDPLDSRNIMKDIVSQTSLLPDVSEKYRCMVVWDTRVNRDVGWLMVRKKGFEGLKPEEVEKKMFKCQWRSCNFNQLNGSSDDDDCRDTLGSTLKEVEEDFVGKNSDEASTSTEAKSESAKSKQVMPIKVDCAVQVEETFILLKDSFEGRSCVGETFTKEPLLETSMGEMSEINKCMLDKLVIQMFDDNNNKIAVESDTDNKSATEEGFKSTRKKLNGKKESRKKNKMDGDEFIDKEKTKKLDSRALPYACSKRTQGQAFGDGLRNCPECDKKIRQRSLTVHLSVFHHIKSVLTRCNVCGGRIAEVNLLRHREYFHPERFKSDIITCSGCYRQFKAVDFDSHECLAEKADSSDLDQAGIEAVYEHIGIAADDDHIGIAADDEHIGIEVGENIGADRKSIKLASLSNLRRQAVLENYAPCGDICQACCVFFVDDDIKYHDCEKICCQD